MLSKRLHARAFLAECLRVSKWKSNGASGSYNKATQLGLSILTPTTEI